MEDKLHPLTELMLARMKSHPEEFEDGILTYGARWDRAIHEIEKYGSDADKQAMHEGLRPIRLGEAHEWAMDELLNGEERRRKQRDEEEEYERRMSAAQQQIMANQYPNQASPYGALSGLGASTVTTFPPASILNRAKGLLRSKP